MVSDLLVALNLLVVPKNLQEEQRLQLASLEMMERETRQEEQPVSVCWRPVLGFEGYEERRCRPSRTWPAESPPYDWTRR